MVQWSSTIRDSGKTTIKLKRMRGGRVGERAFHRDDEWLEAEIARRATLKSYDWAGRDAFPHGSNRGSVKKNNVNSRTDLGREWKRISCVRGNEIRGMKKNNKIKNNNNSYRGSKVVKRYYSCESCREVEGWKSWYVLQGNSLLEYTKILILRISRFSTNILLAE